MATDEHAQATFGHLIGALRAVAEPTRLRLVLLLRETELTVGEICQVIRQSQPRTSRHLRLLVDAGILKRSPEGPFVFYGAADDGVGAELVARLAELCPTDDTVVAQDAAELESVLRARAEAGAAYLESHDDEWESVRALCAPQADIEDTMVELLGDAPVDRLVDIGTGTGRVLELLASRTSSSVGLDIDRQMVALARATIAGARLPRTSIRQGDLHRPPLDEASFDVAVMHHVLHLLDDPGEAIADAARLLRPGGRLLVVELAPHELAELGHRRLGVADDDMAAWAADAGLVVAAERAVAPGDDPGGLTVRMWLLRLPATVDGEEVEPGERVSLV